MCRAVMKPAVRLAQTWFLVSVVPLCVFIFSRLEIQMKCLGVRTDTHPSSSSPLFSLHTRSYSSPRPTFVFASSLNVWLSVQVRVFLPNVEEEVGWRHGRV